MSLLVNIITKNVLNFIRTIIVFFFIFERHKYEKYFCPLSKGLEWEKIIWKKNHLLGELWIFLTNSQWKIYQYIVIYSKDWHVPTNTLIYI